MDEAAELAKKLEDWVKDVPEDPERKDLEPGTKYEIILGDCCIQGTFYGTFIERVLDDGVWDYRFDIGTIGPGWGAWKTRPA